MLSILQVPYHIRIHDRHFHILPIAFALQDFGKPHLFLLLNTRIIFTPLHQYRDGYFFGKLGRLHSKGPKAMFRSSPKSDKCANGSPGSPLFSIFLPPPVICEAWHF